MKNRDADIKEGGEGQPAPAVPRAFTFRDLLDLLQRERTFEPEFADDLEAIQREQPSGRSVWDRP